MSVVLSCSRFLAALLLCSFCLTCFSQDFPKPPTKITPALAKVPAGLPSGAVEQQINFDLVSWQTFVALNWPAKVATCEPDLKKTIADSDGLRVWETYLTDSDVFVKPGQVPAKWCQKFPGMVGLSESALALSEETGVRRFLPQISKILSSLAIPGIKEVGGPLTDLNGRFVRYEVRMNHDEYNYITQNDIWNKEGQRKIKKIDFPQGKTSYGPVGAIELKAAWKVLGKNDDPKRFYKIRAIVFNNVSGELSPGKNPVTLGLIGFHIAHKSKTQANWLWSTFEQNDNHKSFSYPSGSPNIQTATKPYTELSPKGKPLNQPVNVVRINKVESPATAMNKAYHKLLAGTVWENYSLVSTQWSGEFGDQPKPGFLANTVIETYTQGPKPPSDGPYKYPSPKYNPFKENAHNTTTIASASCMKCHFVAKTAVGTNADFSFILGEAQSKTKLQEESK